MDQRCSFFYCDLECLKEPWSGLFSHSDGGRRSDDCAAAACSVRVLRPDSSTHVIFAAATFWQVDVMVPDMEYSGLEMAAAFAFAMLEDLCLLGVMPPGVSLLASDFVPAMSFAARLPGP